MNKLIASLTLLAMTLPVGALAQPDDRPRDRPDRAEDRVERERGEDREKDGDRDGDRRRFQHREPLPVDQVDEAIATIRAIHGDDEVHWLERIEKQAETEPEKAARHLSRYPRIREMMKSRKNNPEEFELLKKQSQRMRALFGKIRDLKRAQRENDQAGVDELKPQVRERIEQVFQVRLQLKELEIRQIREKLAAAQNELEQAEAELADIKADGESLIDEKMNEILTSKPRGRRGDGNRRDRSEREDRPERED